MGACYESVRFKASNEKAMRAQFVDYQGDMCIDRGSDTYAGHMGIVRGLEVVNKKFKNIEECEKYVIETAQKWGPALAIKVGDFSTVFPVKENEKKEVLKLEQLLSKYTQWDANLVVRVKKGKSSQKGCAHCGSKIAVKYINSVNCPVCGNKDFIKTETDKKNFNILDVNLKEQKIKVQGLSKKYDDKNNDICWYIGAWCAS